MKSRPCLANMVITGTCGILSPAKNGNTNLVGVDKNMTIMKFPLADFPFLLPFPTHFNVGLKCPKHTHKMSEISKLISNKFYQHYYTESEISSISNCIKEIIFHYILLAYCHSR